jgi:predicted transposase/invertase (TIGR01784 family)
MKEEIIDQKQGNGYDKILKENMEAALPAIIENVLSLDISESIEIPDDIQYTKERKPDVLKKVTDRDNNTFVLHVEWQSQNDKDMVYRMAEYAVMLYRKYRLPVKQYVIFVGNGGIKMITAIRYENLQFRYKLIDFKKFDYKLFLNAEDPAIKVFAILGNFEKDGEEKAVENIYNEIKSADATALTREKHFNQLNILVKLRNENINLKFKNMISVSSFYTDEQDARYLVGQERGIEETKKQTVIRMKNLGCEPEFIAKALNLTIEKVKEFQQELSN